MKDEISTATLNGDGVFNSLEFKSTKPFEVRPKENKIIKQSDKITKDKQSGKIKLSVPKNETSSLPEINPAPTIEPTVTETTESV